MADSNIFSVRIVSIDYYMAPPISDIDICYSSFQGGPVNEIPVIRIFGSTPAGQKTCLHIHRALPYLYVPCAEISLQPQQEADAYTHAVSLAMEKALKLKGNAASKRQHVHGCSLVRGKKLYGFHSSEELFVKIYLYYPQDVCRAANLLLDGAILDSVLQPYESHIPFLLQFLVDYNLYGMGYVHLSKMKFRPPVPAVISSMKAKYGQYGQAMEDLSSTSTNFEANSSGDVGLVPPVWTSSTVPTGWIWNLSGEFRDSSDQGKRLSTCELEGDATIDEILNQKSKLYSSLSQTCSDVKMVQSLIPIWEEEYERTGMHEMVMLRPDSGKPLPQDVLRTFSHDDFDSKLIDICNEADNIMNLISPTDKDSNFLLSVATKEGNTYEHSTPDIKDGVSLKLSMAKNNDVVPQGLLCQQDYLATDCEDKDVSPVVVPINDSQTSGRTKTSYAKAADKEAMGLLRWLVSSQAAEEMNSDEEDVGEPILSPMFPAMTIDKMLEKANMDFESESQQECQDILDSIQDFDNKKEKYSIDPKVKPQIPLDKMIHQVNESSDDQRSSPCADNMMLLQHQGLPNEGTSSTSTSSLRALMRRKRSYKVESSECDIHRVKRVSIDDNHEANTCLCPKQLDFKSIEIGGTDRKSLESFNLMPLFNQQTDFHASHNEKPACSSYSLYGKLPLLPSSETVVQANTSKDMQFDPGERVDGSGNLSYRISPGEQESFRVVKFNEDCAVSKGHFQDYQSRESDLTAAVIGPVIHNSTTCKSNSLHDALPKKFDTENNVVSNERYQEPDDLGCDILSTCLMDQKMLDGDDEIVFDSLEGAAAMTNTAMPFEDGGGGPERDMGLNGPGGLVSMTKEAGEISAVTFCNKPSMQELSSWRSENFSVSPERALDKVCPILGVSKEQMEISNKCFGTNESDFHQEAAMDLPSHFQNDGSYLYMLTPACSPPSADSVYRWLLSDEEGISRTNIGAASTGYSILRGCSNSLLVVEGSRDGTCCKPDPSYDSVHNAKPVLDKLKKQNLGNTNAEINFRNSEQKTPLQNEKNKVKEKDCIDCLHNISQISGPDRNSKPTPLSQIGFRDPASDGGGQQLTSISIEILAESRGDLRPDPRYDAINIIALVIEDDNDSVPVIYVLLRSNETFQRSLDGISGCKMLVSSEERQLFVHFMKIICLFDPDILLGWEIQGCSLGYIAERASYLGIGLLSIISRTPSQTDIATTYSENAEKNRHANVFPDSVIADPIEDAIIEDEWGRTHASGVHVSGRIVLNIWRLMHGEIKLKMYTLEAVSEAVLRRKIPLICNKVLKRWFLSGSGQARYKCIEYVLDRAKLNLEIINQLDMVNRTSELARVFGIDFFSVLSRGSQYRVESMLLRLAHTQNYIAISPGSQQVASQPAMECIPLVMEPESGFYGDPVLVLDFQSLYPSMIIAYNLCFCTCLGNVSPGKVGTLGISSFSPAPQVLRDVNKKILITPNGVMYVPSKVRKGILPRLLEEILSTRIMVKQAMKKLSPSEKVLQRIFNARQLALKLIANVTYGYTAAGFSGRMPLAELADSIVQCGRLTLETAISFVNAHDKWKAKVIYGDTDSMFVLLKGRTVKEAFKIGQEIASEITAMNPDPVTLKFEKVYHSCFLLTKKRYVGYSYESPDQHEPMFDAKGIETVRRDTCEAVAKTMEQSLRLFFEHQNKIELKRYLQRQWTRILSGRVSLQDFIFAKEVRLGTYNTRTSSLPPAAIVATKAMRADPRAEPRYGERIPYVVIHGDPGARLVDMVVDPLDLLAIESPYRLNDLYYINKQIMPALQRVFGLVGADLNKWFLEMHRPAREGFGKRHNNALHPHKTRIDYYYLSKHCLLCGELVQASSHFCNNCSEKKTTLIAAVVGKTSKLEREIQHLAAICRHCGGGDWFIESGVKCTSLACSVFYERRKVQKELQGISAVATEAGFYPKCNVEWF